MPEPRQDESRDDFIERCIPIVLEDGTAEDQAQAVAVCISMWDQDKGATMTGQHERKTFEFKVTDFDYEGRTIEGYAAVFGNIDQGNDIIHPGAFAKTLVERGNKVRFLWQHDMYEPIGRPLEIREDASGLFIKAIVSDTARGRDALALMRDNAISGLSIGYDAIPGGTNYSKEDSTGVRNLRELRLWEFSLVTFPMNELANVTALKDAVPPPPADTDEPDTPDEANALTERKNALVASLRTALAEAEALALLEAPPAPADNAGRDVDADDQGAGPVTPPTSEDTERLRAELLESLSQLED